jgi:hypothetical protein
MLGFVLFLITIVIGSILGSRFNRDGRHNKLEGSIVSLSTLVGAILIVVLN